MKRVFLLVVPLFAVLFFSSGARAVPLSVPCSSACNPNVFWDQNVHGWESSTFAYQGNLPSLSDWEAYAQVAGSGDFIEIILAISNGVNDINCGINTHGHVYVASVYYSQHNQTSLHGCVDIGSANYGHQLYMLINHYSSNGGGVQTYVCTVQCENASGSQIIYKDQCSYGNCGNFSATWTQTYLSVNFIDSGSTYNNNTYPYDTFTETEYESTSSVWTLQTTGTSGDSPAENPVQWYWGHLPSPSDPGGELVYCAENVGQKTCS